MQEGGEQKLNLLSSGAFGCIYSPSITCKGEVGSAKYVTKIQKSKRAIRNELYISERIRNIKGYVRFFAPVIKYCNVRIAKDNVDDLKKCQVFEDEKKETLQETSYVSMKTRYVGKKDLRDELLRNITPATFPKKIRRTHSHLLMAVDKLYAHNIVHFDLKSNNIIMDSERNVPIIIDFGQSWAIDQLDTPERISTAFFVFSQYDYWCIDILICSYITQEIPIENAKTDFVTESALNTIWKMFMYGQNTKRGNKIDNDVFLYSILQNPLTPQEFQDKLLKSMAEFINKRTWWELYEVLIKYANTWDGYSLAVIHMNMLDDIYLNKPDIYNMHIRPKVSNYVEILEEVLYSVPSERPTPKITLEKIKSLP